MAAADHLKKFGPGLLVTAAFIGPGTVTTATKAGSSFGFALMWTIVFATFATIILQEMSARLGLVTRKGLGEAVRTSFRSPLASFLACALIAMTIGFGNAAYQTGNITGASVAMVIVFGASVRTWAIMIGVAAFALLFSGHYKVIERVLVALVIVMSIMFLLTAVIVRPNFSELIQGAFIPTIPDGALLTVVGLIGTTVVPYNLFLHASSVGQKWPSSTPTSQAIRESRIDTTVAVILGGSITSAIIGTAASQFYGSNEVTNAADMARQLEPLLGRAAKVCFGVGLLSAGLTSAITAPLAAAYAISGVFGWSPNLKAWRFRIIWIIVLSIGAGLAAAERKSPETTILIAQALNGLLLPLIVVFLLFAVNRRDLMGEYRNGIVGNVLGSLVVLVAAGLGINTLMSFFK